MDYKQKDYQEKQALKKAKYQWKQNLYTKHPHLVEQGYNANEIWKMNLQTKNI